ncbi:multidrug ABC transporter permease [Microlunatus endophyticus]|uniref:Multidrug ABC transporter permease n=1 Tax=Microlunatus endophyticus TaxID=1716077 RepID=A0A917SA35_9ACTN|nr:ABC transporter ATP-binding protein [Microlunatus endophyticus]GGL64253.1 multidrug ABC transporter permease [Microlunatus endophyticus]
MADAVPAESRIDRITGFGDHVRMLWSITPGWTLLCLITSLISVGCNVLAMIAIGRLIGALAAVVGHSGPAATLWQWFVIFAGGAILLQLVSAVTTWGNARVSAAYRVRLDELIAEAGLHPRDLGTLEDQQFAQRLTDLTANSKGWLLRNGLTGSWMFLVHKLVAVGAAVIVFSWRWWVPFVVIAAFLLVARLSRSWLDSMLDNVFEKPNVDRQRSDYIGRLMIHPQAAKEIRIFGIGRWLERRYVLLFEAAGNAYWPKAHRGLVRMAGVLLIEAAVMFGALGLLGRDAWRGAVPIGTVTTTVMAILALEAFAPMGDIESGLIRIAVFLRNLFGLRRSVGLPELHTVTPAPAAARRPGAVGIDIDGLTFTYPTRDEPTLQELSLHVPAGQSLAIVGVNGAGKSTLIKLIAGLYPAGSGTVRVDGRDPYADETSRGQVAVVFQDFVHYPLSLRENVGFGAMGFGGTAGGEIDQALLDRALRDAAGIAVLERVGGDWDTVLTNQAEGGTDLSGGQWQRVALARALAAVGGGAGVLVLDEPTAALDVRAEAEIFDRFLDMTHGVTTILVSHRLSTVRRAERIVVLDGRTGRIAEDGRHEELIARGGAYAEMFTLQARRFAMAGPEDPA